jgi:hypothetical protein
MISSLSNKQSRYTQGGISEYGAIGIEWWDKFEFPTDPSDMSVVVNDKYEYRIERMANDFYGNPALWWFICQYNNILDPLSEIVKGRILTVPTLERLQLFFIQKTGGIPSTRNAESILPPIIL